ncbi:MAG: HAMP domain-containing sensor histidine kinase [Bacteroidota bacterium]
MRSVSLVVGIVMLGILLINVYLISENIDLKKRDLAFTMDKVLGDVYGRIEADYLLKKQLSYLFHHHEAQNLPRDPEISQQVHRKIQQYLSEALWNNAQIPQNYEYAIFPARSDEILLGSSDTCRNSEIFVSYSMEIPTSQALYAHQEPYRLGIYFPRKLGFIAFQLGKVLSVLFVLFGLLAILLGATLVAIKSQGRLIQFRNEFINNLAHELKTPVFATSIIHKIARQSLVEQNYEKLTKQLTLLDLENRDLGKRVERILEYSMLEEGTVLMDFQPYDITDIIQQCVDLYTPLVEAKKGRLSVEYPALSPLLRIDPIHIRSALNNLIDNALKYSYRIPLIHVSGEESAGNYLIKVQDNGKGIAPEDHPYIFQKYYRASQGDLHTVKGFGLGLSYVKLIVEKHGGEVTISSNPGKGSTFILSFPIPQLTALTYVPSENTLNGR